jgi:diacylglycerol kinase (ATP)
MRAAAIFGLSSSASDLAPFKRESNATWLIGLPTSSSEADAILIFGGDGTVHRHLAQLVRLQLPVLVVPRGSGNDFAQALNLRSVGDALAAWRQFDSRKENVRPIDLGVITSPDGGGAPEPHEPSRAGSQKPETRNYFCCVGGIGLDSEVAKRANQLPRWIRRRGGYVLSLLPALFRFQPPRVQVKVQSDLSGSSGTFAIEHDGAAMVVAFANAPAYGDGVKIAPRARLDDSKLDICVVENMGKARLLRLFPSVYSGSHLSIPEVKYFQTERLRLETERPMDVYADGEYVCRTPVEVSVERAALRVIVPRELMMDASTYVTPVDMETRD